MRHKKILIFSFCCEIKKEIEWEAKREEQKSEDVIKSNHGVFIFGLSLFAALVLASFIKFRNVLKNKKLETIIKMKASKLI
jgi:ribulose-5-phosphate 4-epimerase/fuculose-1-phosphate aldolase